MAPTYSAPGELESQHDAYGMLRVPELRQLCELRAASAAGTRGELVARLEASRRVSDELGAAGRAPSATPPEFDCSAKPAPAEDASAAAVSSSAHLLPVQMRPSAKSKPAPAGSPTPAATGHGHPDLNDDERTLRGLLQFFICSDVQRKVGQTPLAVKYRELISVVHDEMPSLGAAASRRREPSPPEAQAVAAEQPRRRPLPRPSGMAAPEAAEAAPEPKRRPLPRPTASGSEPPPAAACPKHHPPPPPAQHEEAPEPPPPRPQDLTLRRKAEEALDAQLDVDRLWARREALAAQLAAVIRARDEKAQERQEMEAQLERLAADEERRRSDLKKKACLRLDAWVAAT